ncbi:TIGR03943 family protein [Alkalihalobacillus macyae]|uniref:TIGR03943 family putative permease subunit n=1 Tax=Guptibacillus hwajinpoensis TaxID=208199 RepID=UPI00273C6949|nr:TIGR03943 family protein [Alkalihalobacillus macyae]MDP4551101.1 TIGR03943 family protein [Alkalihalobacillus macyae]
MNSTKSTASLQFHMFLRSIILMGFFLLIVKLMLSETIHLYVAPKMLPFVYFAGGCFFLIGIIQFFKSMSSNLAEEIECNCGADHHMKGSFVRKTIIYLLFIIPVLGGLGLPQKVIDSTVAANRGIQYGGGLYTKPPDSSAAMLEDPADSNTQDADKFLEDPEAYMEEMDERVKNEVAKSDDSTPETGYSADFNKYDELAEKYSKMDHIEMTNQNYLDVINTIDLNLEQFIGKKLTIKGFVYREPDFNEKQIVVARFGMNCCVADASVYGTLIESDQVHSIEEDTWVEVTGTISNTSYNGQPLMLLLPDRIKQIDTPKNPYVYPF